MILTNDLSIIELAQATGELVLFIYLFIYSFIYLFIYLFKVDLHRTLQQKPINVNYQN